MLPGAHMSWPGITLTPGAPTSPPSPDGPGGLPKSEKPGLQGWKSIQVPSLPASCARTLNLIPHRLLCRATQLTCLPSLLSLPQLSSRLGMRRVMGAHMQTSWHAPYGHSHLSRRAYWQGCLEQSPSVVRDTCDITCPSPSVHGWLNMAQSPECTLSRGVRNRDAPSPSDNVECPVPPSQKSGCAQHLGPQTISKLLLSSRSSLRPQSQLHRKCRTLNIQDTFSPTWLTAQRIIILILTSENHLEKRLWLFISINCPYRYLGWQKRVKTITLQISPPASPVAALLLIKYISQLPSRVIITNLLSHYNHWQRIKVPRICILNKCKKSNRMQPTVWLK